jgi:nucleoside-diphosphate-sugar epimerase
MRLLNLGTGYIGRAFIQQWPHKQDRLVASTTHPEKISNLKQITPEVELIKGNDLKTLNRIISECDGAVITVAPKNSMPYEETYLETAQTVSKALEGRDYPFYLLYTSSTSVYGEQGGKPVSEESPCFPESENGKILLETENCYLNAAKGSVTVCILRLGGIFGPERGLPKRAARFSNQHLTGRDIPTNHSSLDTIVNGITWCIERQICGIYNLVESEHPTRGELYNSLCESQGLPKPHWKAPHRGGAIVLNEKIQEQGFTKLNQLNHSANSSL